MLRSKNSSLNDIQKNPEFNDVYLDGKELSLLSIAERSATVYKVVETLKEGNLSHIVKMYRNNLDELARIAKQAFYFQEITREQLTTILEMRALYMLKDATVEIGSVVGNQELSERAIKIYGSKTWSAIENRFKEEMENKPKSEWHYFTIRIDQTKFNDARFIMSLILAAQARAILYSEKNDIGEITLLTAGARDAMTKAVYGSQAKKLFARTSARITKDTIYKGHKKRGRYSAVSFPGIQDVGHYHDIKAMTAFISIHDEIHRQLISAIPDAVFDGILFLLKRIRKLTNRKWSIELWNMCDMDFDLALDSIGSTTKIKTSQDGTSYFERYISSRSITTSSPMDLVLPSAFCDMTWLMLIDMHENKLAWSKAWVDPEYLTDKYRKLYLFIKNNFESIRSIRNPAERIVKLKSLYFNLPFPEGSEIRFSRRIKEKATYLYVMVDGNPHITHKEDYLKHKELFDDARWEKELAQLLVNENPVRRKALLTELQSAQNLTDPHATLRQVLEIPTDIRQQLMKNLFQINRIMNEANISLETIRALPTDARDELIKRYNSYIPLIANAKLPLNRLLGLDVDYRVELLNNASAYGHIGRDVGLLYDDFMKLGPAIRKELLEDYLSYAHLVSKVNIPLLAILALDKATRIDLLRNRNRYSSLLLKAKIPFNTLFKLNPTIRTELLNDCENVGRIMNAANITLEKYLELDPDIRKAIAKDALLFKNVSESLVRYSIEPSTKPSDKNKKEKIAENPYILYAIKQRKPINEMEPDSGLINSRDLSS